MHSAIEREKPGWYGQHVQQYHSAIKQQARVVLLGDSIVANLSRYPNVWDHHLEPLNVTNCGIRGDRSQNVMWRVERMQLPATTSVGIIHCGINDIGGTCASAYGPREIAENVISCGTKLADRYPLLSVIVMGILPARETFVGRNSKIDKVNEELQSLCRSCGFLFVEPGSYWRDPSCGPNAINHSLYYKDGLHLCYNGCRKLAEVYADVIRKAMCERKLELNHQTRKKKTQPKQPPTLTDSCTYIHIPVQEEVIVPVINHTCHNRLRKTKYRQKNQSAAVHKHKHPHYKPIPSNHHRRTSPHPRASVNQHHQTRSTIPPAPVNRCFRTSPSPAAAPANHRRRYAPSIVPPANNRRPSSPVNRHRRPTLSTVPPTYNSHQASVNDPRLRKHKNSVNCNVSFCLSVIFVLLFSLFFLSSIFDYKECFFSLGGCVACKVSDITHQMFSSKFVCRIQDLLVSLASSTCNLKWCMVRRVSIIITLVLYAMDFFWCKMIQYVFVWIGRLNIKLRCRYGTIAGKLVIVKKDIIITVPFMIIKKRRPNHIIFKAFLLIFWVLAVFQKLNFGQNQSWNDSKGQPHPFQVQNYIVDASSNQIYAIRSHIFLYACSNLSLHKFVKKRSFDDRLLLLLCGDIEANPGPGSCNWYSLSHPSMCPFYRTAVYMVFDEQVLIPKSVKDELVPVDTKQGFEDFLNLFQGYFETNLIDLKKLKKNIQRFMQKNKDWGRRDNKSREDYYSTFRPVIWINLSDAEKRKHSIDCKQCPKIYPVIMAKFPSSSNSVHEDRMKNPVNVSKVAKRKLKKAERGGLKACLNEVTKDLNQSMEEIYDISFDKSFQKFNKLVEKPSYEEKRQMKVDHFKDAMRKIQAEDENTMVDRCYGARISLKAWNRERMKKCFENVDDAIKRSKMDQEKIEGGAKKRKDHIGSYDSYEINKTLLFGRAVQWTDNDDVNWKSLGDECITINGKIPANAGQIVKGFLHEMEEKHGFQFTYKGKGITDTKSRLRRAKLKLIPGVSFPTEPSAKKVKLGLQEMVKAGEIDIGENIVEREYQKTIYDKSSGQVVTKYFSVFGRKHPLDTIRKKLFIRCKKYMRLNPDSYFESISREELVKRLQSINEFYGENEDLSDMKARLQKFERTRHLQVWHDGSVLTNHGHVLFCINVLYDPAVFYTSSEYALLYGVKINVQREVEYPEVYIVARCNSTDEQLAYINTRLEDLKELKNGLNIGELDDMYDGIVLNDIMRYFHGDGPATQLEAGNKKGGHYFCPSCDIHICQTDDIACSYQHKTKSLADKQTFVLSGRIGKRNTLLRNTVPFERLSVPELKQELLSRKVDLNYLKDTMKDLVPTLKKVLRGVKRLPILLLNNPECNLSDLGLQHYEISLVECMHDIAYHIENILVELPNHIKKPEEKVLMTDLLSALNNEKEKKRCCDRRKCLLILTKQLHFKIDGNVHRLLRTLSEIQRILYLGDDSRTPKEILRLHNLCYEHFVLLKELIPVGKLSAKMTRDKLYGKYLHNLLVHAPTQYRLVSGESVNVEDEERVFNTIRNCSHSTTNNWPGHIIGNLFVRLQVENQCKEKYVLKSDKNSVLTEIEKIGRDLYANERNSLFTYDHIKNNLHDWQSHLERISDFLIFGDVWWKKTDFGIEFFDYNNEPNHVDMVPKMHHFRSSNVKSIAKELEEKWKFIVNNQIHIPLHVILKGDGDEKVTYWPTNFLGDKIIASDTPYLQNVSKLVNECDSGGEEEGGERVFLDIADPEPLLMDFQTSVADQDSCSEKCSSASSSNKTPKQDLVSAVGCSTSNCPVFVDYATQEGSAIAEVLGGSPLLTKYDHTKSMYKSKSKHDDFLQNLLIDMQAQLKTRVLKEVSSLKEKLDDWERSFMVKNDMCVPSKNDYLSDNYIAGINKKVRIGNQLLKKWSIQF